MNMNDIKPRTAAQDERELFSARLRHALKINGYSGDSMTKLQREFNARATSPITVHAARKWLMGESIPTQPRIKVLADWLGVSAAYLRFGIGAEASAKREQMAPENVRLLSDLAQLPKAEQETVRKLVRIMASLPGMAKAA